MYKDSLGVLHDDNGSVVCERCGQKTSTISMSWLNTQMICSKCSEAEKEHPNYKAAREAERAAVLAGNYNYSKNWY